MHVVSCTQRWYIITTGDESGITDNLQGYFTKVLSHVHATKSDSEYDIFSAAEMSGYSRRVWKQSNNDDR